MRLHRQAAAFLFFATLLAGPTAGPAGPALAREPIEGGFPASALLPKKETGVDRFLARHARYDGRGVVVAIFDTGVDPGAPGLQKTTDGRPKIVDLVDGSGSGDVDTSTVRKVEKGAVEGLSGRTLRLGKGWRIPSGEVRVGLKPAWELFPGALVARLKAKRREAWDETQRLAEADLLRRIEAWDAENPKATEQDRREKKDLELRLERLRAAQKSYEDVGPVYDCVVWNDGKVWRAAIDTDEDGDLGDEKALASFRVEREYATFGDEDLMNFGVNVYDDGDVLSIVADTGAHGTHVAGIVAAHFPDQPELNGIAPGAQIVSVKIGDTRVGSSSLGQGEVRGLVAVLENGVDVINMSYGGPSPDPNSGRFAGLFSEIVNEHGVIFVASAGNEGPALMTAGSAGGTTTALYGIGATVSPEMMKAEYSLREEIPEIQYTWSSRGPTLDGDLGVDFSAPGAAISPVPNWVLRRNQLMNGTSMSSPNVAGGVALLLSGLKAEGIAYSPHSVKRALSNTARDVPGVEVFALGRGQVQIDKAWEHLKATAARPDNPVRYEISVSRTRGERGILLRDPEEATRVQEPRVNVRPVYRKDADNRAKVDFEMRLALKSTADWVDTPSHVLLMHGGRNIDMRVDPTGLPPGAHYAEVRAFDVNAPDAGPVFRVPVTVIRPEPPAPPPGPALKERTAFRPGQIVRRFIAVPEGATWADVAVRSVNAEAHRLAVLHAVQILPGRSWNVYSTRQYIRLEPGQEEVRSFKVAGGSTLEIALAQYWSSLGASEMELEVHFHGLRPDDARIDVASTDHPVQVDVEATLRDEVVAPSASMSVLRRPLRPTEATVRPLEGRRDLLPEGRQIHELVLTYDFKADEAVKITPRLALEGYEEFDDDFESSLWMLFDKNKRRIAASVSGRGEYDLSKGDYVLRFHVRHDDTSLLEGLKDAVAYADIHLKSPVTMSAHADPSDALMGGGSFGSRRLPRGSRAAVFFAPPGQKALPKVAQPGDVLVGEATFGGGGASQLGAGKRPGGWPVSYVVPAKPARKDDDEKGGGKDPRDEKEPPTVEELMLDAKVGLLADLRKADRREPFDALLAEILAEKPDHLPALKERLEYEDGKGRDDRLEAVVAAADAVIEAIDRESLAAYYGRTADTEDPKAKAEKKEMDEKKGTLVDALRRRAAALADLHEESGGSGGDSARDRFHEAFTALRSWDDSSKDEFKSLEARYERSRGRHGRALEILDGLIDNAPTDRALLERRADLYEALGWEHWAAHERAWLPVKFPADYPPF